MPRHTAMDSIKNPEASIGRSVAICMLTLGILLVLYVLSFGPVGYVLVRYYEDTPRSMWCAERIAYAPIYHLRIAGPTWIKDLISRYEKLWYEPSIRDVMGWLAIHGGEGWFAIP